jgi:hypothetical protein
MQSDVGQLWVQGESEKLEVCWQGLRMLASGHACRVVHAPPLTGTKLQSKRDLQRSECPS